MKNLKYVLILSIFLSTSCTYNRQYINNINDKKDAIAVTNRFYDYIKSQEFDSTTELFSPLFFDYTNKPQLKKILHKTHEELGSLISTNIIHWETRRKIGTNPLSEYFLIFENKYENYIATEKIRLIREQDSIIRIVSYQVNSEGFF